MIESNEKEQEKESCFLSRFREAGQAGRARWAGREARYTALPSRWFWCACNFGAQESVGLTGREASHNEMFAKKTGLNLLVGTTD